MYIEKIKIRMALWRLFCHFVWSTKERKPLLKLDIEPQLYYYIIGKADALILYYSYY